MSIYLSNERRLSWLLTGEALFFAFEPLNEAGKQYFEGNRCAQYHEEMRNICYNCQSNYMYIHRTTSLHEPCIAGNDEGDTTLSWMLFCS